MARPKLYNTEEERRKARREAVKRCNDKKKVEKLPEPNIEPQERFKVGRPKKYETEEERKEAQKIYSKKYKQNNEAKIRIMKKRYYQKNREIILNRSKEYNTNKKITGEINMKTPTNLTEMINYLNSIWSKKSSVEQVFFEDKDERDAVMEDYDGLKEDYSLTFSKRDFLQAYLQLSFIKLELFNTKQKEKEFNSFFTDDLITEHTLVYYFVWTTLRGVCNYDGIMNGFTK